MDALRGASVAGVLALLVVLGACSGPDPAPSPVPTRPAANGGTLRLGVVGDEATLLELAYADPGRPTIAALLSCCLARTLLTYPGRSTIDGGTVLQPDLAREMPSISADGRTWTFHLRQGIRYAPPHGDIEVTATDFVHAVERAIRIYGDVPPPFMFVAGAREFADGSAPTVSGLETPDPYTLVIRLTRQYGGLHYLTDPAWAPLPSSVSAGHDDDLGFYWPSTGPYMYATYPADASTSVARLVRNPSWNADTDGRRRADVAEIEVSIAGADFPAALAAFDAGQFDFITTRLNADAARVYRSNSATASHVRATPSEYLYRLPMNLAVPPFDDIHVRRAAAFAIDRAAARDAISAALNANGTFQPATVLSQHMFGDSVTGGLLTGYDPFTLGDGRGNLSRARTEMARSSYDGDGDGVCDDPACDGIELPTFDVAAGNVIARSLEAVGLRLVPVLLTDATEISFPRNHAALSVLPFGWGFELSGSEMAILVAGGEAVPIDDFVINASLVGATPDQLAALGYEVTEVPSVDDVIQSCEREAGHRRARCWAELDQLVAESVVPWVPLFGFESVWVSSPRVESYSLDQAMFQQFPALDSVRLVAE